MAIVAIPDKRRASVWDQSLARELGAGLRKRRVAGRQDHVGGLDLLVVHARAVGAHEVKHLGKREREGAPVGGVDGAMSGTCDLVEPVVQIVVEAVLVLA